MKEFLHSRSTQLLIAALVLTYFVWILLFKPGNTLFGGYAFEWYALLGDPVEGLFRYFFALVIPPLLGIYGVYGLVAMGKYGYRAPGNTPGWVWALMFYINILCVLILILTIRFYLTLL